MNTRYAAAGCLVFTHQNQPKAKGPIWFKHNMFESYRSFGLWLILMCDFKCRILFSSLYRFDLFWLGKWLFLFYIQHILWSCLFATNKSTTPKQHWTIDLRQEHSNLNLIFLNARHRHKCFTLATPWLEQLFLLFSFYQKIPNNQQLHACLQKCLIGNDWL